MELAYYISMLKRRWIAVVAVPALVALFVLVQVLISSPAYTTSAQFTVTRVPQQMDIQEFRYNEYYLFLSSEFFVDDLVEVVLGSVFAADVHERIQAEFGVDIPPGEVQMALDSDRTHRILTVDVAHENEDAAVMIAQSATRQLNENAATYFGFDDDERGALVETIQFPGAAMQDATRDQIFWALQLLLAVFAGVLIGLLLEYLDDTIYSSEMVEHSLDLDVIGEVPNGKGSS